MRGTNRIESFSDVDGTLHVECRFTFTPEELVGDDLSPWDRVLLRHLDVPEASLAHRLQSLAILVRAKERSASGDQAPAAETVVDRTDWCEPDDCPASICNGPHVSHTCVNGDIVTARADNTTPCPFCGATNP